MVLGKRNPIPFWHVFKGNIKNNGQSISYGCIIQRNKKNITLNLRSERGRKLLDERVKKMDVVVRNYPQGTEEAELFTYDRLRAINPALVVAAVSGFGQSGPYAERLCFDAPAYDVQKTLELFDKLEVGRHGGTVQDNGEGLRAIQAGV